MIRSLFFSVLFFLGCVSVSFAQEYNAKFSPGLLYMSTNTVTQSGYMTALEFEAVLNNNTSINGGLNFFTGGGTLGMFLKPELRFYLTDVALRGLYIGPYAGLGSKGGLLLLAGGSVGYQHLFSEYPVSVSGGASLGMEFRGAGGLINLNFHPTISVGYHF